MTTKLVRQAKSMEKRIARLQEEQSQVAALAPGGSSCAD